MVLRALERKKTSQLLGSYEWSGIICWHKNPVRQANMTFFCCLHSSYPVQFSHSVMSDSLQLHGLQHAKPPCPSSTPRVYSNSCSLSQWCHPPISTSVLPSSFCPQSFPTSRFLPVSWLFTSGGWSVQASASASVLPMNLQGWFPLGLTGLISLLFKGLSRVFSSTTVWNHQFFGAQSSLQSKSHTHTLLLEKP